jgi:hypothetical protein
VVIPRSVVQNEGVVQAAHLPVQPHDSSVGDRCRQEIISQV